MGNARSVPLKAVLFDRDGTLVVDVPYNADPQQVRPMPGAPAAVRSLREAGIRTGVLTNQSGIARGFLSAQDAANVNSRVDELLGPFDVWCMCPHGPDDGCDCRKPAPGMILSACRTLDVEPAQVAFIGDIGSDVRAAENAGALSVLVPTAVTRAEEISAAPLVVKDLCTAARLLLAGGPGIEGAG